MGEPGTVQVTAPSETGQLAACVANVQEALKGKKEEYEKGALVKNDSEDGHPDVKKDEDDEDGDGLLDGETVLDEEGRPTNRRRTSRLKEQNSRAQRRYRERQKQQKEQMENELGTLRNTASRLSTATEEKDKLEKQLAALEKRLKEQQEEIGTLQHQNQTRMAGSSAADMMVVKAAIDVSHLQLQWVQQVHKLGAALAGPQADEAALSSLVDEGCALFHELLQSIPQPGETPSGQTPVIAANAPLWVKCLFQTDIRMASSFSSEEEALHWKQVAMRMSLDSQQCVQLVQMRDEVLKELEKTFAERVTLFSHLQLLKSKWKMNVQVVRTIEAKLALLQMICQEGVLLLEKVVKNLSSEQHTVNSITRLCTSKVLLPSETIRFMVESQPHPAKVLLLVHLYAGAGVHRRP